MWENSAPTGTGLKHELGKQAWAQHPAHPWKPGQAGSALQKGCVLRITNFVPQKAALSLSGVDSRSIRNQGTSLVFTAHYKYVRYFFQIYTWGQGI